MKTAAQQAYLSKSMEANQTLTIAEKFSVFCNDLEEYRVLLLSAFLLVQGCIIVPFTILITSFIDLGLGGISISLLAAGTIGVLITNMAETPIKAIIIAFSLSLASSISIIAIHLLSL
jgi:hypothetical protein